jgi:hypothetical protein
MPDAERDRMVETIATTIEEWGLASPAILLGEANRPLAFLGSQILLMSQPLLGLLGWSEGANRLASILGDSRSVECLISRLERGRAPAAQRSV